MITSYDVVIRTFNSARTLKRALESLHTQTVPPANIIVIDSGSTDETVTIAKSHGADVWPYGNLPFNFSRALNLGVERVKAPGCLVISSHVIILESDVTASLLDLISKADVPAAYVNWNKTSGTVTFVDTDTFDGNNGLWNTCAMYRTDVLRNFSFDEDVPSAEDQHLASRLFIAGFKTGVLGGPLLSYENPYSNSRKWRNVYVSVAYFSYRKNMSWRNVGFLLLSVLRFLCRLRPRAAYNHFVVAIRIVFARYKKPQFPSRYFKVSN